jgi:O-antigen/teichoic acid export membrane protein
MIFFSDQLKKTISTSGINFLFRIFGLVASFVITVYITKWFGLDTYGNYSLVFGLSQIIAILFTLGIPNTLIKIIGNHNFNHNQAKNILYKGIKGTLFFSIIPLLFFYFGSDYMSNTIFENPKLKTYFLVVAFSIPLFIVHEIFLNFFIAIKDFFKYNLLMFVIPNILLFIFLYFFKQLSLNNHHSFIAFSCAILITVVIETLILFEINPKKETVNISTKELLKTASPFLFSGLFLYLLNYTNIILLEFYFNDIQVGIYNIAYKVGSVGFLVIVSVSTIITPKMAELYGKGNIIELKKLTNKATQLIAILSTPIVFILIFYSKYILSFWGTELIEGNTTLIIISIGVLLSAISGNVDQLLNMTENQNILRNITFFSFFVNLILGLILIPIYGIVGAAISSLITNVLINLICIYYIKKKLGFYTLF